MTNTKKIPLGRPFIKKELVLKEIERVLDRRWLSGGPAIEEFEKAVKTYNNDSTGHYVAISNATVGLELSLRLLNNGNNYTKIDEVIVPSWSWVASGFSVYNAGATPVWCDVNEYGVPYVEDVKKRITSNTKAIIIVHQMGIPCDMDEFNKLSKETNIPIIEDSACGFGSEYKNTKIGNTPNICVYSFQARKCLTTGEGGMIVVRNEKDAEWLKSMRAFGTTVSPLKRDSANFLLKEQFDKIGTNFKMSDIQCALGIAHITYFDEEITLRQIAGDFYNSKIKELKNEGFDIDIGNIAPSYCTKYNWQNFHFILGEKYKRDEIVDKLRKIGVGCKWDIQAIHLEPVINESHVKLEMTEKFHNHGMWLPFYAEITREEQSYVIDCLKNILKENE